jgi:hypothetical protein
VFDLWDAIDTGQQSSFLVDDIVKPTSAAAAAVASSSKSSRTMSQWADEEGFYKVNVILRATLSLVSLWWCPRPDANDTSKIIFGTPT